MDGHYLTPESPTSVLPNGSFKASKVGFDNIQEGLATKDYDKKEGREEKEDFGGGFIDDEVRKNDDVDNNEKDSGRGEKEDYSYIVDLQARAAVKFNKMTFCKEFIYHTFFPLSAPLMYYLDGGWFALTNRGFVGWDNSFLVMSQIFWAANFWLLNVVSLMFIVEAKDLSFLYDIMLVDLLWAMRNSVVATKYAFLSKIEMEEMRTKKVPPYVHQYRTLLSAWKDPIPSRVLKYELLLAALRNKLMLRNYSFTLDTTVDSTQAIRDLVLDLRLAKQDFNTLSFSYGKRAHQWLEIGSEELTKDPLAWAEVGGVVNMTHLPARLYAAHVIRQASSLKRLKRLGHQLLSQHLRKCCGVLGVAHAVIPAAGRYIFGGHPIPGPKWTDYCVLIPSFILISFAMVSNLGFMMIGVLDFRRRHFFAQSLDDILRTGVYSGTQYVRTSSLENRSTSKWGFIPEWFRFLPQSSNDEFSIRSGTNGTLSGEGVFFDFSNADSLLAWWTCRQLLTSFGYGFYKRIKYYTTYFAGYCVILLVFLVLKSLTGLKKQDFYLLITVIFSIDVFLTLLALMVWPGGDANCMLQLHGTTLIRRKIRTQMKMIKEGKHLKGDEHMKLSRATIDTITSIAEAVKWDNSKTKLSICGLEARDQLVSLIVAVVTASMSIAVGQIVQNGVHL